jgi:hypothetical protein
MITILISGSPARVRVCACVHSTLILPSGRDLGGLGPGASVRAREHMHQATLEFWGSGGVYG